MKLVHASAFAVSLSLAATLLLTTAPAQAQISIGISINVSPPILPVYVQPPIPAVGYMWTPGYWAWDPNEQGYYWVPGTWIMPPQSGYLWTPPYYGWNNGAYEFHGGYWGQHVGFYGGISYGYGYGGSGYGGGYWQGGSFFYNRSVNNISSVNVTNVYEKTVIVNNTTNVSFNGGPGGVEARPTAEDVVVAHEAHLEATASQTKHVELAHQERANFASVNHGKPAIAATARPGVFTGAGVVKAEGAKSKEELEKTPVKGAGKAPEDKASEDKGTTHKAVDMKAHEEPVAPHKEPATEPRIEHAVVHKTLPTEETEPRTEHAAVHKAPRTEETEPRTEHAAVHKTPSTEETEPRTEHAAVHKTPRTETTEPRAEHTAVHTTPHVTHATHEAAPPKKPHEKPHDKP